MNAPIRLVLVCLATLSLVACGFHLRRNADLPAGMHTVYVSVSGDQDFARALTRALVASNATVVDAPKAGVAHLNVSSAGFRVDDLTMTGQGRISEKVVRMHVQFAVLDDRGHAIIAPQSVDMSREFTYDASNAIGQGSQVRALQQSLIQDMVQAVMFRLEAAAPASASTSGA